jgi:hypothetical protein
MHFGQNVSFSGAQPQVNDSKCCDQYLLVLVSTWVELAVMIALIPAPVRARFGDVTKKNLAEYQL